MLLLSSLLLSLSYSYVKSKLDEDSLGKHCLRILTSDKIHLYLQVIVTFSNGNKGIRFDEPSENWIKLFFAPYIRVWRVYLGLWECCFHSHVQIIIQLELSASMLLLRTWGQSPFSVVSCSCDELWLFLSLCVRNKRDCYVGWDGQQV